MLNEAKVKNSKPKAKSYMLRDENGLYLKVDTAGRKYWILRYWEGKKERQISLGVYPEVSLKDARIKRDELQAARAKGELISLRNEKNPATFSEAAAEWVRVRMKDKAAGYLKTIHLRLNKYILPFIGNLKLNDIKSPVILKLCRQIENN